MSTLSTNFAATSSSVFLSTSLLLFHPSLHAADNPMQQFKLPAVQEPRIPSLTVNVTNYGAIPDGKTLNTGPIAKAIATLAEKGGGRLVFPPGLWLTGPIALKNNVELHVEEGALVLFTPEFKQYPDHTLDMKGLSRTRTVSPIHGENLHDIAITGRGVFDGSGDAWRPVKKSKMTEAQWKKLLASGGIVEGADNNQIWWPSQAAKEDRRPVLMKLVNCRRILLDGVTFQNSPGWNLNRRFAKTSPLAPTSACDSKARAAAAAWLKTYSSATSA